MKRLVRLPRLTRLEFIIMHLALLSILFFFVVRFFIPWSVSYANNPGADYQEGRRAYLAVVNEIKPTFITCLRGLNLVGQPYTAEWDENGRHLITIGLIFSFDQNGKFRQVSSKRG